MREEPTLKRKMFWNAFGNMLYMMAQWIITVLVGRMDFEAAGVLSVAMSISATFQTIAMYGIHNYQVSDVKNKYSQECYISFRIISCLVSFSLCSFYLMIYKVDLFQAKAIILYMIFRIAESFSDVLHSIAQKRDRIDISGKSFAIKALVALIGFCIGNILTGELNVGLMLMALLSVLSIVIFDVPAITKLGHISFWEKGRQKYLLARETLPLCLYLCLCTLISTLPKILLEKYTNEVILGAYASIYAPALLISAATGYLYNPFILSFANAYDKKNTKDFWRLFLKIMIAIFCFASFTIFMVIIFGESIIILLFGAKIIGYAYMLTPIVIAIFVNSIFILLCVLESVVRDFKGLLVNCALGIVIEFALSERMIVNFGPNGTSYTFIISSVIATIGMLICMLHRVRIIGCYD